MTRDVALAAFVTAARAALAATNAEDARAALAAALHDLDTALTGSAPLKPLQSALRGLTVSCGGAAVDLRARVPWREWARGGGAFPLVVELSADPTRQASLIPAAPARRPRRAPSSVKPR